jgi:hypothetical protein
MSRDFREDYDRPERSSGTRTVFIVLGILGGLFLLGVIGCLGVVGWGVFNFQKQFSGMIATFTASEAFLSDLQANRIDVAYASTSAAYQAKTSRKQFDEFLAEHPLLTKHTLHTQRTANLPMQGNNTKTATISYVLNDSGTDEDDEPDPDDHDAKPKPKVEKKKEEKKKDTPKSIVCTLVLIEENGKWVIDQFTVP